MKKFVLSVAVLVGALGVANCGGGNPGDSAGASLTAPSGADGKPGTASGSSSSFTLAMVTDANGNGAPNWGDRVTFNVTTSAAEPHVDLKCSQNGVVVASGTAGFYDSYPWPWTKTMSMFSPSWTSGAANCTATLYVFGTKRNTVLATLNFTAAE
jgi:hypothetical protein